MISNVLEYGLLPRAFAACRVRGRIGCLILASFAALASSAFAQPVNDRFTNATVLSGNFGSVNGTTVNATIDPGEPAHFGPFRLHSVWFRWVAPASGLAALFAREVGRAPALEDGGQEDEGRALLAIGDVSQVAPVRVRESYIFLSFEVSPI